VMVPEFLDTEKVIRQGCAPSKLLKYPGVKEGVYLWNYVPPSRPATVQLDPNRCSIFIRPEPRSAQYYKGQQNFLDDVIVELQHEFNVVLLPRDATQRAHYTDRRFAAVQIPAKPVGLDQLLAHCDLFIGAGGSMTRELAVLGVQTISVYQDELLDVDRFLIQAGAMLHNPRLTAVFARKALQTRERKAANTAFLDKGREAYALIRRTLTRDWKEGVRAAC